MTIYYSHSIRIYDTEQEEQELDLIQEAFPGERIINPSGADIDNMDDCYDLVSESNCVNFSLYRGKVGRGVYEEVKQAQGSGKPVYIISNGRIEEFNGRLKRLHSGDWKVRYAEPFRAREAAV